MSKDPPANESSDAPLGNVAEPPPDVEAHRTQMADELINLEALKGTLQVKLAPKPAATALTTTRHNAKVHDLLEEIAEDMLEITRRLKGIEEAHGALVGRLGQLEQRTLEGAEASAREVDALRRELLGDRKTLLSRAVFNAIVSHVDSLRAWRQELTKLPEEGGRHGRRGSRQRTDAGHGLLLRRLDAVDLSLITAMQGLGFQEFQARPGEPFLPGRMECLAYESGPPGVVIRMLRPGYCSQQGVVRPAGVTLSRPTQTGPSSTEKGAQS